MPIIDLQVFIEAL
jgi:isopenicillin N synthase-like dioxygenase